MRRISPRAALLLLLAAAAPVPSAPSLGKAEAACRPDEPGPALLVRVQGLKDRKGLLRAELYPANDEDFLADDNVLVQQGKVFRRVDLPVPASGDPVICMRLPDAGHYTLSLLHDRDQNLKFGLFSDGVGFSNNPKLQRTKPKAASVAFGAGQGMTRLDVRLNYFRWLSMRPIGK